MVTKLLPDCNVQSLMTSLFWSVKPLSIKNSTEYSQIAATEEIKVKT